MADVWGILQALMAIAFLAVPAWLAGGAALSWQRSLEARDWQPVPAKVDFAVDDRVALAYESGGRRYVTDALTLARWGVDGGSDWRRQHFRAVFQARAAGKTVTVFMDPRDPSRAVFARDFPFAAFSSFLFYAGVGLVFGSAAGRNAWRLLRGHWANGLRITELSANEKLARLWISCAIWNFIAFMWAGDMLGETAETAPYREALLAGQALGAVFAGVLAWLSARRAIEALKP